MSALRNGTGPSSALNGAPVSRLQRFLRLLHPGVGLKRWALVGAAGVAFCSIGVAYLIRKFFAVSFPDFLPWYFEGFFLLAVGGGAILLSMYGFYRALSPLFMRSQSIDAVADTVYNRWSRGRGPKLVAIGGGTGLSVLLRGLRLHTDNLTAIITVGDDGGSSGILRRELGVLPPGDFRNCLVALSEDESLLADLFQYRFDEGSGLKGHSFGNLFIVAMTNVTKSFNQALVESSRVLAVRGGLLPSTPADLRLTARFADGTTVRGESSITERGGQIERLMIEPADALAHPLAVGHRRGRHSRDRSWQPVHEHPAQHLGQGHIRRAGEDRRHRNLRLQRRHTDRRDRVIRRPRPRNGAPASHLRHHRRLCSGQR